MSLELSEIAKVPFTSFFFCNLQSYKKCVAMLCQISMFGDQNLAALPECFQRTLG